MHINETLQRATEEKTLADQWKVIFSGLIDAAIVIVTFTVITVYVFPLNEEKPQFVNNYPFLLILTLLVIYRFVTILFINGSIGMHLFRIHFLNGNEEALSLKEKALASIFILFMGVEYYNK